MNTTMKKYNKLIVILLLASLTAALMSFDVFASASASRVIAWGAANSAGDGVRIRSGPGLTYSVLTHAGRGDPIVILERTNSEWYKVNYAGNIGYVSVPLLERPRTAADFNANGKVAASGVNMRQRPSTSSSSLGTYSKDTVMVIIGINEGWYKVRFDNKTGYIRSDLMDLISVGGSSVSAGSSSGSSSSSAITGRLTGSKVNMREGTSTSSAILGTYAINTVMDVLGIDGVWYKVSYSGRTGYVHSDYMQVSSTPPNLSASADASSSASTPSTAPQSSYVTPSAAAPAYNDVLSQQIADLASSLVGSKYVYGGASPSGFDCSGLVYYVYSQFGITLTRNASGQYRDNGTHINKSELKPGDLVFTSSNGREVTHVGIYIGNNKMVHASTPTTGVIITTLDGSNYSRTVFGAKRVA